MPFWPYISLTSPIMLGGLALLVLPIAAHALHRHAQRRVVFPTIRLMKQSVASHSRLFRLRRWILLALRCLMVALIVAAFARPIWFNVKPGMAGSPNSGSAVVVLLDASASTSQTSGTSTAFHSLKTAANHTLDGLISGTDQANLVVATAHSHTLFPNLTRNLPALRTELNDLQVSHERADLRQAIGVAGKALGDFNGPRKLVIHSDLQQSNWDEVLNDRQIAKLLPSGTQVTLVVPTFPVIDNVALSQPRHFPTQPLAEQPLQLIVKATNFSNQPKQVRTVVKLDGQPAGEQTVTLAANEQRDMAFDSVLPTIGEHLVEFSTAQDLMPVDDQAYLSFNTVNKLPILIVSDDQASEPGSASYFLLRALAPRGDTQDRFDVRQQSSTRLSQSDLASATAVFVGYLSELHPPTAELLKNYTEQGGGLLIFCGEGAVSRNLQVLDLAAGDTGLLPWQPGPVRNSSILNEPLRITGGKWQSRLLSDFDEQSQLSMSHIRFQQSWTVGAIRPESQVLLTYSDGSPALGLRQFGLGQVLLANFSPSLESSDLAKYGSFVALVQSLAKQLRPAGSVLKPPYVGESHRITGSNTDNTLTGFTLRGPDGQPVTVSPALDADRLVLDIENLERSGFYQLYQGQTRVAVTAVNLDPRESDPQRIDHTRLTTQLDQSGVSIQTHQSGGWTSPTLSGGKPIWGPCVMAAMCVVALELFLTGLWRR